MGYPRILVVDDEENFLNLLSKILGKEGYEIRATADGDQALTWLEELHFDLAIVDIRMHPVDGFSVLERIRARHPGTKVIMMTAYPAVDTRTLSFRKGAIAYLVKPINIEDLKAAVRKHLLPQ